jgi:hypothetical protein
MLVEVLVHVEGVPQKVRLVAPTLAQALEFGAVEVVGQDGLVVGVGALLDDFAGTLTRRHAGDVGEADFGDDHVNYIIVSLKLIHKGDKIMTYDRARSGRRECTWGQCRRHQWGRSWRGESRECA